ncbi:MAG: diaminopimelate epimerase [Phycisphaerae bacterium]|nr:diaminopimelate epimerase [Phycisphaerae bacterium]
MTEPITFTKLSGSGNDFICLANLDGRYDALLGDRRRLADFARALCRRGLGIGADGLVFACPPEIESAADVSAHFMEPDGSESELCGNGTACFVKFLIDGGHVTARDLRILTPAGVVRGRPVDGEYVRVCIPIPTEIRHNVELHVEGTPKPMRCDVAVTGTPHAVIFVDDVDRVNMPHLGPLVRHHPHFGPRGANVNFVQVLGPGRLAIRTWEFGVESETLACGTGSATAAVMASLRNDWPAAFTNGDASIDLRVHSGDTLRVWLTRQGDTITDLCLDSIVRTVFHGTLAEETRRLFDY